MYEPVGAKHARVYHTCRFGLRVAVLSLMCYGIHWCSYRMHANSFHCFSAQSCFAQFHYFAQTNVPSFQCFSAQSCFAQLNLGSVSLRTVAPPCLLRHNSSSNDSAFRIPCHWLLFLASPSWLANESIVWDIVKALVTYIIICKTAVN